MELTQKMFSLILFFIFLPKVILQNQTSDLRIISLLKDNLFQGKWMSKVQSMKQFNYLTLDSGEIQAEFGESFIQLFIQNPKYQEKKHVIAKIQLSNYSESSNTWIEKNDIFLSGGDNLLQTWTESQCNGIFIFQINQESEEFDINELSIDGDLQSTDTNNIHCQINLSFNIKRTYNYAFINNLLFSSIATLILIIQMASTNKLIQQIKQQQIQTLQLSFLAAILSSIQGLNIFYFFVNTLFQNFNYAYFYIIPTFLQLTQAIFKDSSIVGLIWGQRQMLAQLERRALIKQIIYFILISNFFIILNLILYQLYGNSFYFMLTLAFALYPQVIHNVRVGQKNYKFNKLYVLGFLSSKLFFYPYVRSCPANVRNMEPDYLFAGLFLIIYLFSLFLLYIQEKYGSRCFIPKFLLPKPFRYIKEVIVHDSMECPICLNPLNLSPDEMDTKQINKSLLQQIMVTPCKHEFHPQCLQQWIQIQNKCPQCRRDLPPFIENEL
ncbi:unnamed protein product [Paramecium sonneborni]|uniref:RING-type E3 ubiquitin transferase n=1 Tax=Paramecium sonneborni TaxID=65129 RepID=A0A8S1KFU4_9CILI|nr:unnamed protein product [Paramecium sonneborni]